MSAAPVIFAETTPAIWLVGIIVAIALVILALGYFNPRTRERRRREKSYGRIISKSRTPSVKLAVKTKKRKD